LIIFKPDATAPIEVAFGKKRAGDHSSVGGYSCSQMQNSQFSFPQLFAIAKK
jgi:hypothetical protein